MPPAPQAAQIQNLQRTAARHARGGMLIPALAATVVTIGVAAQLRRSFSRMENIFSSKTEWLERSGATINRDEAHHASQERHAAVMDAYGGRETLEDLGSAKKVYEAIQIQ